MNRFRNLASQSHCTLNKQRSETTDVVYNTETSVEAFYKHCYWQTILAANLKNIQDLRLGPRSMATWEFYSYWDVHCKSLIAAVDAVRSSILYIDTILLRNAYDTNFDLGWKTASLPIMLRVNLVMYKQHRKVPYLFKVIH